MYHYLDDKEFVSKMRNLCGDIMQDLFDSKVGLYILDVENNVINFYYTKRTDLSYTVNYLEKGTNKVLANEKVIEGNEGDEYTTKSVTIDKYTLDKEPANKKGTIKEGTTEVIYYYYLTKIPAKDEVTLKPVNPENKVESDDPFSGELPETGIGYASMIVMILIISIGVVNIVVICVRRFVNKNNK